MTSKEGDDEVGHEAQYFVELDHCKLLCSAVCREDGGLSSERALDEVVHILDKYLEQPLLIAAHIVELLSPVNEALSVLIGAKDSDPTWLSRVGTLVYALCRVAGYKHTTKHFLHEVEHLEKCLNLLEKSSDEKIGWEATFMLLQWLSTLSLIPFDISSMDSTSISGSGNGERSLVQRIVACCQNHLADTGPTRDAAAVCISALLTRPDMDSQHLAHFMAWAVGLLAAWSLSPSAERAALNPQYFQILGALQSVFRMLKLGHRSKLAPFAPTLLPYCVNLFEATSQTAVRKLLTKIVQRIGMNFLPPRIASWRYMRGSRSLSLPASRAVASADSSRSQAVAEVHGVEEGDVDVVPEALEEVLDCLLCAMRDKDTVVRWSAAKGIGRIAMRLPREHAADVVEAVLEAFSECDADSSWHGGCLTLAELARRGLLLPERLPVAMPLIARAIRFDVVKGKHSIGAHVRDAACYVCWAFSRAYSPAVMAPYIKAVAASLLTTALFDREINCRRAASAAYQEMVGRQGDQNVPRGIEILTVADYVSVGNRASCFSELATTVAGLDSDLPRAFVEHLFTATLRHWDREMRGLGSLALASLVRDHSAEVLAVLPQIIANATASSLNLRHGCIVAAGDVVFAMAAAGVVVPEAVLADVAGIPAAVEKARLYKDRGGEIVREAVAHLIGCIARAQLPLTVKQQVTMVEALNEHLRQPHVAVQSAAQHALRELLFTHFATGDEPSERLQKLTVLRYLQGLTEDSNVAVTRGYASALGALPVRLLALPAGRSEAILEHLTAASSPQHAVNGEHDADTSCRAVSALVEVAEKLCDAGELTAESASRCFEALLTSCADYSVDNRGDTGSWSRTLAMKGAETIINAVVRRIQRCQEGSNARVREGDTVLGSPVWTSWGAASVTECNELPTDLKFLQVSYPAQSVAWHALSGQMRGVLLRSSRSWDGGCAQAHDDTERWTSLLARYLPAVVAVVLKQLAEKLDAVRDIAGAVIVRLLREPFLQDRIPDSGILRDVLFIQRCSADETSSPTGSAAGSWANPEQVFPVVCGFMRSPEYFAPVLSGLVVSVGGLSETVSKVSGRALAAFCQQCGQQGLVRVGEELVGILLRNKRVDRVAVPTMKTLLALLDDGALDPLLQEEKVQLSTTLRCALKEEVRGTSNLSKVRVAVELSVRLLSFCGSGHGRSGLCDLLPFLTHRFPLIRKYCAEQVYLYLLLAAESLARASSAEDMERAVQLLSCTAWEGDCKADLVAARAQITRSLGYSDAADALVAAAAEEQAEGRAGTKTGKRAGAVGDELDSYEALVRDAGY